MKSISSRIIRMALGLIFFIAFMLSAVSITVVNKISNSDSETLIMQQCEKETQRFNNEFTFLENSVYTIEKYIEDMEEECDSEKELLSDEFCNEVQDMTISIANRTDGAMAVYFRYDPELTGNGTQGFFWSRDNDDEKFEYCEPTDILQYEKNDTEHVGWFYEPKEKHEAIWMTPYYNKNLDVYMISYVIPYYTRTGTFLGVIGMDIDFNKIVELTGEVNLYETGKINLVDLSAYYLYGTDENGIVTHTSLSTKLYNHITTIEEESEILKMTDDQGITYLTCVGRLTNDMRLMLSVPYHEINAQRNRMVAMFTVIMAVSVVIAVALMFRITNKIVMPLKNLTRITGKYARGDWSETFVSDTEDEIQELSESISVMAETTKSYIDRINENATTDALTGLKNRNCYLSYIEKFDSDKEAADSRYALVIFDINFLKKVNDGFGHEAGDRLIIAAGEFICSVFEHSPIFRIGGDEYTAILENRDYTNREDLLKQFAHDMKKLPPIVSGIPLSISYGMACFPEDGADFDQVFKCADERMYECKKDMKAVRK